MPEEITPCLIHQEWPEELKKEYDELPEPSLYEHLVAQEKLAFEIRKQNKELRLNSELIKESKNELTALKMHCQQLANRIEELCEIQERTSSEDQGFDMDIDNAKPLDFERDPEIENNTSITASLSAQEINHILIQSLDGILNMMAATHETSQALLDTLPASVRFWNRSPPAWRKQSEQIINGYSIGVETIRDKLLSFLADLNVEVIIPEINTPFSPHLHRAIAQIEGGKSRSIAKVIRYGYAKKGELLRCADVVVYR